MYLFGLYCVCCSVQCIDCSRYNVLTNKISDSEVFFQFQELESTQTCGKLHSCLTGGTVLVHVRPGKVDSLFLISHFSFYMRAGGHYSLCLACTSITCCACVDQATSARSN